jgi:hypothetical protein
MYPKYELYQRIFPPAAGDLNFSLPANETEEGGVILFK